MITALAIIAAFIVGLALGYAAGRIVGSYRAWKDANRMADRLGLEVKKRLDQGSIRVSRESVAP